MLQEYLLFALNLSFCARSPGTKTAILGGKATTWKLT
jgi:hypothetical protein